MNNDHEFHFDNSLNQQPKGWPDPPAEPAFYGLIGKFVQMVEPHTEADPVALMIQFLVFFGICIGRTAHFVAEADQHFCNLFAVLVGQSSKGRKGTSAGYVKNSYSNVDPDWAGNRVLSGLSSGEGLIWKVRDDFKKKKPQRKDGKITGYEEEIEEHGIQDKRLLVLESEFASVLKMMRREGNVLSAIIRLAWDTGHLQTLTKGSQVKATNAHIGIVGHITLEELGRDLKSVENFNGFGNRFLWIPVRRSQLLPEGGRIDEVDFKPIYGKLRAAVEYARNCGELRRDEGARELWCEQYARLSSSAPGMFGAVTARAEAQVMRLACIYALLDCSPLIRIEHLQAALALWDYAYRGARYIFGSQLCNKHANKILQALIKAGTNGLTSTQISKLFHNHLTQDELAVALKELLAHQLIETRSVSSGGRNTQIFWAREKSENSEKTS